MTPDATATNRIVQGLDDLQTFKSQLEHVRSLVRVMESRRSLLEELEAASVARREKAGFFRRRARSA